jgi:hypothetical protein
LHSVLKSVILALTGINKQIYKIMKDTLYQQINALINKIQSQQKTIEGFENKIPQLDIDVQLNNIRKLYDDYLVLNNHDFSAKEVAIEHKNTIPAFKEIPQPEITLNHYSIPTKENESEAVPVIEEEAVIEESTDTNEIIKDEAPVILTQHEKVANNDIAEEESIEEIPNASSPTIDTPAPAESEEEDVIEKKEEKKELVEAEPIIITDIIKEEVITTPQAIVETVTHTHQTINANNINQVETVADKYKSEPSLYDKMTKGLRDKSLATQLQRKPIYDLRIAIGLNEKFEFINILFNRDGNAYAQSIDDINKCANLQEAEAYIASKLMSTYNWEEDNSQAHNFMELIERRFM